jgi:hypothetical protein
VKVTVQVANVLQMGFPSEDSENYTLEYSFQHMAGSLPAESQKMYSSEPELNNNWIKVSCKRDRSAQEETE